MTADPVFQISCVTFLLTFYRNFGLSFGTFVRFAMELSLSNQPIAW